jgi:hypothetical protein
MEGRRRDSRPLAAALLLLVRQLIGAMARSERCNGRLKWRDDGRRRRWCLEGVSGAMMEGVGGAMEGG